MTLTAPAILLAGMQFACWEAAMLAAAIPLARSLRFHRFHLAEEQLHAVLAIDVVMESSFAGLFSFLGINSPAVYWVAAAACVVVGVILRASIRKLGRAMVRLEIFRYP